MEEIFDMKKNIICTFAIMVAIVACNPATGIDQKEEVAPSNAKTVTVHAGGAGTKTAISEGTGGNFHLNWKAGDQIVVWEGVPNIAYLVEDPEFNGGYAAERYVSSALAADADIAEFQLNLEERAYVSGEIQYVAVYPASCAWDPAGGCWDDDKNRMIIPVDMPTGQNPTADSFDPNADILVSKTVIRNGQRPDELSFQFARVGTIVKMVVGSLPPGAKVTSGSVDLGYDSGYYFQYDPELEKIVLSDGTAGLSFWYDDDGLVVGDDGKATVWLRSMSGVSDRIELYLYYTYNGQEFYRHRIVNLRARGKTLEFKEGGLTEFSIGVPEPDVENPDESEIDFFTNSAMNGATVYWPVSTNTDYSGYDCFLMDKNGTRFDFSSTIVLEGYFQATIDSGLAPGTYTIYVRTLAIDGKVSQPDYEEKELEIGAPMYQTVSYVNGHFNYGTDGLELGLTDTDSEDLYWNILYHHRNLFWQGGSPNHFYGKKNNQQWGFWNGEDTYRWSKMYVKTLSYGTGSFSVYASDTFFADGTPADAEALPYSWSDDNERVYDLGRHHYFLICGNDDNACHFDYIRLEYFK